MGFPSCYTEEFLPNFLVKSLSFFTFLRMIILNILKFFGLPHFIQPDIYWPEPGPEFKSISSALIQEMLPATRFGDIATCDSESRLGSGSGSGSGLESPESCAVCLYEFRNHDEIRQLVNCKHVFHKGCVDRWMDHDQRSCPLCRTSFVPDHLVDFFNQRLEAATAAASSFPEFGSEFSVINNFA